MRRHLAIFGHTCVGTVTALIVFLSGCGGPAIVGLHPEYPPVEKKTLAIYTDFVEVNSLQPTIRWQAFSRPADDVTGQVQNITYELRIWTTKPEAVGKLIYARENLSLNAHRVEAPLHPSTEYFWSVRAHFTVEGQSRVTEWGMAGIPLRNESVPNLSCYRFKTPEARP